MTEPELAGLLLLFGVLYVVPRDIAAMRRLMRERSAARKRRLPAGPECIESAVL